MSHKPSAVFTLHDGHYVGSLRAPLGIDLVKILEASRVHLDRFGGHAGAAGCTILANKMPDACALLRDSAQALYAGHDATPIIRVDTALDPTRITTQSVSDVEVLRPFGL